MKLTNIRLLGRYKNPVTGKEVNIRKGRRLHGVGDVRFYLFRQRRIIIPEMEFFHIWEKQPEQPTP